MTLNPLVKVILKTSNSILYVIADDTIVYEIVYEKAFYKDSFIVEMHKIRVFQRSISYSVERIDTLQNKWDAHIIYYVEVDEKTAEEIRERIEIVKSIEEFEDLVKAVANIILRAEERTQRFYECLRASC